MFRARLIHPVLLIVASLAGSAPALAQDGEGTDQPVRRGVALPAEGEGDGLAPGYGKRHALVIGINEYEDPTYPDLGYAVADARAMAKVFVERFGFEQEDACVSLSTRTRPRTR